MVITCQLIKGTACKKNSFSGSAYYRYFSFAIVIPGYNFEHATTSLGFGMSTHFL